MRLIATLSVAVVVGLVSFFERTPDQPNSRPLRARDGRQSYEDSCRVLQDRGWLGKGAIPAVVAEPRPEGEDAIGVMFFRKGIRDAALENLTLPRSYFGLSEIFDSSLKNTDLSESTLGYNSFATVDFTDADLSGSNLRGSFFTDIKFLRTDLRDADLRRSTFQDCDFTDADLRGAKLTPAQRKQLRLSEPQLKSIDWQEKEGWDTHGG